MPLPTFDTKDKVPEAFRDSYVEKDGKWVPDIEDTTGLKASQRKALDEKKQLEDSIEKALKGKKLEDITKLLEQQETDEEARQRKAGEHDKILEKRLKELRDELEPKVKEGQTAIERLSKIEFEDAVWAAAKKAGALDSDRKLVIKAAEGDYVRRDKAGKLIVVDADGDATGEDLDKLFTGRFKKDFAKFYSGSGSSGGGATTTTTTKKAADGKISVTDQAGFLANVDKIAKGEVAVDMGE